MQWTLKIYFKRYQKTFPSKKRLVTPKNSSTEWSKNNLHTCNLPR